MGLIRFLLAISIVSAHYELNVLKFVGSETAVQAFYAISGFYMQMVIPNYSSKISFWIMRYLRIFPTYCFCSILTLFFLRDSSTFFRSIFSIPFPLDWFMLFTNITILFQDIVMFIAVESNKFFFTGNFLNSNPRLYTLLLLPQAWSLGLELSFYLLVPFILKRNNNIIIFLILSSLFIKSILFYNGFSNDPWSYRFLPSELSIFLLGSISYRVFKEKEQLLDKRKYFFIFFITIITILFYDFVSINIFLKKIIFSIFFILSLGPIFSLTRDSRWDIFLGNLSFPIYCSHFLPQYFLPKLSFYNNDKGITDIICLYSIVLIISYLIHIGIDKPFDILRSKFKTSAK